MKNDPFIVKVNELLKETGAEIEVFFEARPYYEDQPFELADQIKIDLLITNTEQTLLVTGTVSGKVLLKCGRCLKNFPAPFVLDIEEQFARPEKIKEITQAGEFELRQSDFIFKINHNDTIDLKELIRQNILMSLPIKPLCSPKCPRVDKSVPEADDPRLEEFKKIKNKLKEKK